MQLWLLNKKQLQNLQAQKGAVASFFLEMVEVRGAELMGHSTAPVLPTGCFLDNMMPGMSELNQALSPFLIHALWLRSLPDALVIPCRPQGWVCEVL